MPSESNFTRLTKNFGLALLMIGLIGFLQAGGIAMTALIPAAFGLLELVLGLLAERQAKLRRHIIHFALLIALLLFFGTARSIPQLFELLQGSELNRPNAILSMAITSIAALIYLILGVQSFVKARQTRSS